jgi:CheY-like chemotaxis protein
MKKILIVEDVEFNRDLVVQLLEEDYEIITAADAAEGLRLAERERPDLILMDLSLPVEFPPPRWKRARVGVLEGCGPSRHRYPPPQGGRRFGSQLVLCEVITCGRHGNGPSF